MMTTRHAGAPLFDTVIVGAGPAGSALACHLAGQGWRVLLVERERLPRHKVCGEFLSPEAQSTLRGQTLDQVIAAHDPVPLSAATLTTQQGRTLSLELPGTGWGISRYALDAALAQAAAQRGVVVWTETAVTRCLASEHGASEHGAAEHGSRDGTQVVELRPRRHALSTAGPHVPTTIHARTVVLACGRQIAATLLPATPLVGAQPIPAAQQAVGIKCHFAHLAMPAQVELYLFPGGYVGINPVEHGHANVCVLASYEAFARAGRTPRALIEAAAQWNPAFGARLRGATPLPASECVVAGIDTRRKPTPWHEVPRVGDSAAMIPPLVGDGMAMALHAASLCGPVLDGYLRRAYSWTEAEARYCSAWHRVFDQRLRLACWLERVLLVPRLATLLVQTGAILPPLANYLVRTTRGAPAEAALDEAIEPRTVARSG